MLRLERAPAAGLYGAVVRARRWMYDRGLAPAARVPVPVVSIGGLEAGGSGKTPVCALVTTLLLAAGRRPGIATRGYRRRTRGLVLRPPGAPAHPDQLGDEPAMLVWGGLDVPIAACGRRLRAAGALADLGCDVVVLDDGFAHRALARDLDVVVLRGEAPQGDGHLLPWGTLREPPSSLRRAHLLWYHFRQRPPAGEPRWHHPYAPTVPVVVSRAVPRILGGASLAGARVLASAGIARPDDLAASLRALGAEVVELCPLPDHHRYTLADVERLQRRRSELGADAWVVTPKDAVKLDALTRDHGATVVGVDVRLEAGAEDVLREALSRALAGKGV